MSQELVPVLCTNGLLQGATFEVDITKPTFDIHTMFGTEVYHIIKSPLGAEEYTAEVVGALEYPPNFGEPV